MNKLCSWGGMFVVLATVVAARGDDSNTNKWRVQVGYVHQWGRGMRISGPGPSLSGDVLSSIPLGSIHLVSGTPAPTYDLTSYIPRTFLDGHVSPDRWTTDPGLRPGSDPTTAGDYGMTWNWRADNASQYNYDNGNHPTLTFHLQDRAMIDTRDTLTGSADTDDLPKWGIEVKATRWLHSWTNDTPVTGHSWSNIEANLDFLVGVAWFPQTRQRDRRMASRNIRGVSETYTYLDYYGTAAGGSYPPLDMPYSGTYDGPGPLLPELPESVTLTTTQIGSAQDRLSLESRMWHLRGEIGLELSRPVSERLTVSLAPQFALEFVDMTASRSERATYTDAQTRQTTVFASSTIRKHKMAVVPGFLLTAGLDYRFTEHWYAGASVGWEWLAYDPSIRVGPNRMKFDLDGFEGSLYLGRHF